MIEPDRNERFTRLRATVDLALVMLEKQGAGLDVVGADLVKLGTAVSLANAGAAETIEGLRALLSQIEREFPSDAEAARVAALMNGPAGRA